MKEKFDIEITGKVDPLEIGGLLDAIQEKVDEKLQEDEGLPDLYEFYLRKAATTWVTEVPSKGEVTVTIKNF
jgi:hypothetical protein